MEIRFDLVLSTSMHEDSGEQGLLILANRVKEIVYSDLIKLVFKLLIVSIV